MSKIITERLIMQPFQLDDINYLIHLKGSQKNMAETTVGPISAAEAAVQLDEYRKAWKDHGIGVWSLTHKASGAFVGECGFVHRPDLDDVSLRYTLNHSWWGQGLAPEAVKAALDFGLNKAELKQISALALNSNTRSARILQSAGMTVIGDNFNNVPGFQHYQLKKA